MAMQAQSKITEEEYLELERQAEHKSEYSDGEAFAMAGASPRHVLIVSNIVSKLDALLADRSCIVFSSDLRLRVRPSGLNTYPDVAVACGELRFENDALLNPLVLIEVLSKSTQDYDRGTKFAHYRMIESLIDYVLVAQERMHVEHFTRRPDGLWVLREIDGEQDEIELWGIDQRLMLRDIYRKIELLEKAGQ